MLDTVIDFVKQPKVLIALVGLLVVVFAVVPFLFPKGGGFLPPPTPSNMNDVSCNGKTGFLCLTRPSDGARGSLECQRNSAGFLYVVGGQVSLCQSGCSDGKCNASQMGNTDAQGNSITNPDQAQTDPICLQNMNGCAPEPNVGWRYKCSSVNNVLKVTEKENCEDNGCENGACRTAPNKDTEGGQAASYGCSSNADCQGNQVCFFAGTINSACMGQNDFCNTHGVVGTQNSGTTFNSQISQCSNADYLLANRVVCCVCPPEKPYTTIEGACSDISRQQQAVDAANANCEQTMQGMEYNFTSNTCVCPNGTQPDTTINSCVSIPIPPAGTSPIDQLGAIVQGAADVAAYWSPFTPILNALSGQNKPSAYSDALNWGGGVAVSAWNTAASFVSNAESTFNNTVNPFNPNSWVSTNVITPIVSTVTNLPAAAGNAWNAITTTAGNAWNGLTTTAGNAWAGLTNTTCQWLGWGC